MCQQIEGFLSYLLRSCTALFSSSFILEEGCCSGPNMSVCSLFPDDMWPQRAVIKWPKSGAGSQSVSSALLLSHSQTGIQCWGLSTEGQQH